MIDATEVYTTFMDCLYSDEEVAKFGQEVLAAKCVTVQGIFHTFGFNPDKLEKHKDRIFQILLEFPDQFMSSKGGGWSFLNACNDKEGNQWGEHQNMEQLICLGIAIGKAKWMIMPRPVWKTLPGGMPYFVVLDKSDEPAAVSKE